ncbi:MAG: glycosyltransferase family A protein [Beijerinckiaceae bacterium]
MHARSWRWRQVWLNLIGKSICYITAAETFYGEGSIGTRRMRTCVFTVMHAGNERYFGEFLTSLAKQSDLDFELLVINDAPSWQDRCCGAERMPELPFRWRWIDVAGSIVEIRKLGLSILCREKLANAVIFIDSDDCMAPNRVEVSKAKLKSKEVLFSELILFGENRDPCAMLKHHFEDGRELGIEDLTRSNCLGLSNTACLVEDITPRFRNIPDHTIAFDWAFYIGLLHDGCSARFTSSTYTLYRQYAGNTASLSDIDDARILRSVLVKAQHYHYVAGFSSGFSTLRTEFDLLLTKLNEDGAFRRAYCAHMRANAPHFPLWWENARAWEGLR